MRSTASDAAGRDIEAKTPVPRQGLALDALQPSAPWPPTRRAPLPASGRPWPRASRDSRRRSCGQLDIASDTPSPARDAASSRVRASPSRAVRRVASWRPGAD